MASIYANQADVEPYTTFISDNPSDELFENALIKADGWINDRLNSRRLPTFTIDSDDIPDSLRDAAAYYAISDIVLVLYQGEDMLTQYDIWFQKAERRLDDYVQYQTDLLANTELKDKNPCRWSKTPTWNELKGRKN